MTIGRRANEPLPTALEGTALGEAVELDGLIRRAIDPLQLMQRVADQALAMIEAADGVLVGLLIDEHALRFVCGSGRLNDFVGEPMELQGSLSGQAINEGRTLVTLDTESDERVNRGITRLFKVRSSVNVPLGPAERPLGVINVCSTDPNAFDEHDVELLSGVADFIGTVILAASQCMEITGRLLAARRSAEEGLPRAGRPEGPCDASVTGRFVANVLDPRAAARLDDRSRIEEVLEKGDYRVVFQPIFDLAGGRVFAAEALARFGGSPGPAPDLWFAQAHRVGLGVELEVALFEAALARIEDLPAGVVLALNAGPEVLSTPRIAAAIERVDARRIIIELTEHVAVEDYPQLSESLAGLRARGVRLAIDDAGAGFASLMHILKLAPDLIKLDRELVRGIDSDPVRRSLADSLIRFAADTGAMLIAEGVETPTELAALTDLGIPLAQGFYLAKPGPIEEVARRGQRGGLLVRRERLAEGPALGPVATTRAAVLRP